MTKKSSAYDQLEAIAQASFRAYLARLQGGGTAQVPVSLECVQNFDNCCNVCLLDMPPVTSFCKYI